VPALGGVAVAGLSLLLLGLLLYSLMFAAVGATGTRASDAQTAALPITLLLLLPYLAAIFVVPGDPDGPIATALSVIPFTSPVVLPSRIALGHPSAAEIALAYALLPPAIAAVAWLGGKVYAAAILSTGRVSLTRTVLLVLRTGRLA